MKIDTFIQLIKDLRQNQINDDTDPNNTTIQMFTSPYDEKTYDDAVRVLISSTCVWGDGKTYTAYDSNNQPYQAPSCGWYWGSGGQWGTGIVTRWNVYQNNIWSDLSNNTWSSL